MARGQRDFGMYSESAVAAGVSDMAELAVRLGSIDIFDRRGTVICLDDFESPASRWYLYGSVGGEAALDSTYPKSGGQCVRLYSGLFALSIGGMSRGFTPLQSKLIGAEISFHGSSSHVDLTGDISEYDGTNLTQAKVKFHFDDKKIYYLNSAGAWVEVADTAGFASKSGIYHTFKLVVDFDKNEYVRFIYADAEYDLSGIPLYSVTSALDPMLEVTYEVAYFKAIGGTCYLDDFILTMDEP